MSGSSNTGDHGDSRAPKDASREELQYLVASRGRMNSGANAAPIFSEWNQLQARLPRQHETVEEIPKKRKSWKKPEGMPKRPLSAYNIFFRFERQSLLGEEVAKDHKVNSQAKRKHRKTHGKIGFADMARTISSKWKSMDPEEKKPFEVQAATEKQKYLIALEEWKKEQAEREAEEEIVRKVSAETKEEEEDKRTAMKPAPMQIGLPSMRNDPAGLQAGLSGHFTADLAVPGIVLPRGSLPSYFGATPPFIGSPARASLPASFGGFTMPSIPTLGSGGYMSAMAGDLERRRRLEQLYQLHLQEAACLRDEMQREGQPTLNDQIAPTTGAHSGSQVPYAELYQGRGLGQPGDRLGLDHLLEAQRSELLTQSQRSNLLPQPVHGFFLDHDREAQARRAELAALEQALETERRMQLERQFESARRRGSNGRDA